MKVLIIQKFFYRSGGAEVVAFELAKLLRANGHQVIEFSMKDERNEPSAYSDYFIKNINYNKREGFFSDLKKFFKFLFSFEAQKKLKALVEKEKPDIAHVHNVSFYLTPSIFFTLKKLKVPIVRTLHDYRLICPNSILFTKGSICEKCKFHKYYNCFRYKCVKNDAVFSFMAMLNMYLHKLILKSYDQIDFFISPSKFLISKFQEWGMDISKFKQLYNFMDLQKLQPSQSLGEGIIFAGRLSPEKGILSLLAAMKNLPQIKLQIAGEGPQKKDLENFIKENHLINVELLGYKKQSELHDLIKASKLVIVPSIWYENNPLSILEAFSFGKPVIGTDLGGMAELISNGQNGLVYKLGDIQDLTNKISNLYNNNELVAQMGRNARQFVEENCDPQTHLQQILQIYKSLVE